MKETPVQQRITLLATQLGNRLWRNNVGSLPDLTGRWIRYGLSNESKEINEICKSSDLIGITELVITPEMVGYKVGVFTAIETKKSDWRFIPSDKRAIAQSAFHDIVRRAGGFAGFARNDQEYRKIIGK